MWIFRTSEPMDNLAKRIKSLCFTQSKHIKKLHIIYNPLINYEKNPNSQKKAPVKKIIQTK